MGASADEIDRQISATRDQIDANLDVLERRAASGAKRAGVIAGAGLVAAFAVGGVAYLVYRRVRRPSITDRLRKKLPDPPKMKPFKVVITDRSEDARPSAWESIGQRLAPTIVSSAVSAVMAQALRRRRPEEPAETPAE